MKKMLPYSDDYEYPLYLLRSAKNFVNQGATSISTIKPIKNRRLSRLVSTTSLICSIFLGTMTCLIFLVSIPYRIQMPAFTAAFCLSVILLMVSICSDSLTLRYKWRVRGINKIIRDYNKCDGASIVGDILFHELSSLEQNITRDLATGVMSRSQHSVMKSQRRYAAKSAKYRKKGLRNVQSH